VTAALFVIVYCHHGATPAAVAWAAFASLLVVQFLIDFDTQLLPDDVNYPLLWGGLIAAATGLSTAPLRSAVWGAIWGYLSLWMVFHVYRILTGKEGFGYGDFKLLAGLGAWFGGEYLIAIILLSSIVGSLIGGVMLLVGKLAHKNIPIPFGPYLAGAGLLAMAVGPAQLMAWVPFAFPFAGLAH
jgi:leader peptidase (prepilin peptidase)/N-methyltransferase